MRLLIWLVLIYVGIKIFKGIGRQEKEPAAPTGPTKEETFQDPVCGVYVSEDDAVIGRVDGERVYFCSMACLEKYRAGLEQK
ncbi:hypothetical protein GURASL_33050 [Geotalea uraniireducens]|uniref:TRASH domain-containing protein n=1 Tax=Geotalea uraniireducens TaxID=351604 RepID=A0ABM8EP38_9BACT|nr:transcriptional regulator [Geotalea uraniireducens]BDV44382.1 hypothetical protein GURASL_33050 [Geotalea uraniireducens]